MKYAEFVTKGMREADIELEELAKDAQEQTGALMDVHMLDEGEIFLSYIERGSEAGSGGKALSMLLKYADENHFKIVLTVLHNSPVLVRYYQKLGFKADGFVSDLAFETWFKAFEQRWTIDNEEEEIFMVRKPR